MRLLSLSTAEQGGSLSVTDGGVLVCEEYWNSSVTHSRRILPMIDHLLSERAQIPLDSLDGFVAAKGPGSFTGLRIGISVMKGFSDAFGKPAMGVSSLDGIAYQYRFSGIPVMAMMDARRNEVYCACYQFENGQLVSKTTEQVTDPQTLPGLDDHLMLFAGSGAAVYRDLILEKNRNAVFDGPGFGFVRASMLAHVLHASGKTFDAVSHPLIPSYIRKSDAELQYTEK